MTRTKMGVASHRPDEMAIHVDENADAHAHAHTGPADGDAHDDIDANVDDNITGVNPTDVELMQSDTSPLAPRINNQLTMATGEDATGDGEAREGGKGRGGEREGK